MKIMVRKSSHRTKTRKLFFNYTLTGLILAIGILTFERLYSSSTDVHGTGLRHHSQRQTSISSPPDPIVVRAPEPTWDDMVRTGRWLMCLMEAANEEEARKLNEDEPVASTFTAFSLLERWGYSAFPGKITHPYYGDLLDQAFEDLGINQEKQIIVSNDHFNLDSEWNPVVVVNDKGQPVPATDATFNNVFNPEDGCIIADINTGPRHTSIGGPVYPDLQQWSDIVFLNWQAYAGSEVQNLKWCFRANVQNYKTTEWVREAFRKKGWTFISAYKTRARRTMGEFTTDTDEALAILATPNGLGCAYLLAQHKEQLGVKKISSVYVWSHSQWDLNTDSRNLDMSMYFTIMDVPVQT